MALVVPFDAVRRNEGVVMATEGVDLKGNEVWESLTKECDFCDGLGFEFDEDQANHERWSLSSYADAGRVVRARPRNRPHWRKCGVCDGRGRRLTPMGHDLALLFSERDPGPTTQLL